MNHQISPVSRRPVLRFSCALLSFLCIFAQAPHVKAQQQSSPPTPQRPAPPPPTMATQQTPQTPTNANDDEVVQINTNLVQVDVTVTDKDGRQVTDLRPEDFEVYQNDRLQQLTNFSYITLAPRTADVAAAKKGVRETPVPPVPLRPEQVKRTMAIVVDDLTMSFFSYGSVKDTLKKFIQEQLQPGDMVSIVRTGVGTGAFQQFTSDKRQLLAVVNRMRWLPRYSLGGVDVFEAARNDTKFSGITGFGTFESEETRQARLAFETYRTDVLATGSLGTINYVVRGLRDMPGRKSVVLFSDGFGLPGGGSRVADALRRVTDQANRAAVTLYTVDARGLVNTDYISAADDVSPDNTSAFRNSRSLALFVSQSGLNYLAAQTGGHFTYNANDLGKGLRRALDEQMVEARRQLMEAK